MGPVFGSSISSGRNNRNGYSREQGVIDSGQRRDKGSKSKSSGDLMENRTRRVSVTCRVQVPP